MLALVTLTAACGSDGEGSREVQITQADGGCTPTSVEVTTSEKITFVVKNESGEDYEIEGEGDTDLEEVIVPKGRTRTVDYTVPDEAGTYEVKCYVPGGVETFIEIVAAPE